ncbi:class I SAM-dependent methyltransferase [Pseudonocardia nematodicida]|uniref:Class I SAM-dependent methyltransferase n=1 Tax=Pseudonocardia nematodicida TaxID=1206997 RepID=A0ABV1KHH4_9PSEU
MSSIDTAPNGTGAGADQGIYDLGEIYDAIYSGRGKDYAHESAVVADLVRRHRPRPGSLLDVGCGTGTHLDHLRGHVGHVEGIDLTDGMLTVARRRLPGVPLHHGDMRTFDLGRRFDAVVCLFAAVGNLADGAELDASLARFAAHLTPGGVVVVEPWWFPDNFTPHHVGSSITRQGDRTVARVSHTVRHSPGASRMEVHYVVAEAGHGIRRFVDEHVMALLPRERYQQAFTAAGLDVDYHPDAYPGNGVFVGVAR